MARIFRAEMLRAAVGPGAQPAQAADLARLNQYAQHLADCHDAQEILRANGHGAAGMSVVDVARSVPGDARQVAEAAFKKPRKTR
jgi:hypothetical protein